MIILCKRNSAHSSFDVACDTLGEWQTQLSRPQLRARRQRQQKEKQVAAGSSAGSKMSEGAEINDTSKTAEEVM